MKTIKQELQQLAEKQLTVPGADMQLTVPGALAHKVVKRALDGSEKDINRIEEAIKPRTKINLGTTAYSIRKAISKISNLVIAGEIDAKTANALLYACNTALNSIRVDEQQKQIEDLQVSLEELKTQR